MPSSTPERTSRHGQRRPRRSAPYEAFPQLDLGTHHGTIVQLLSSRDGRTLLSAGETTVRVWNAREQTLRRLLLGQVAGGTDDGALGGKVQCMALSADERWLVCLKPWPHPNHLPAAAPSAPSSAPLGSAYESPVLTHGSASPDAELGHDDGRITEVQVFELASGNLHARFAWPGLLLDLDFSADGRWFAMAGNRRRGRRRRAFVALFAARDVLRPGLRAAPEPLAEADVGTASAGDLLPATLRFVPPGPQSLPMQPHRDTATLVTAVGGDRRDELVWLRWSPGGGLVQQRRWIAPQPFEPATLAVGAQGLAMGAARLDRRNRRGRFWWIEHDAGPAWEVLTESAPASAALSPDGRRLALGLSAELFAGGGEAPPGHLPVLTNVYDLVPGGPPALRSSWFGHDASVRGLAFLDGDTVASSGGDCQAIHFWRCATRIGTPAGAIRGVGRDLYAPGITNDERVMFGTVPGRLLPPRHPLREQSFDLRAMRLEPTAANALRPRDFASAKWWIPDFDQPFVPLYARDRDGEADLDQPPDLSLFVGSDGEWVLWSRSGYTNASSAVGASRIGYRINRGPDKEALFVPSDRFKDFDRPVFLCAVVRWGSEERARRRGGLPLLPVPVATLLPPIVELEPDGAEALPNGMARLRFTVRRPCPEHGLKRVVLLRNDRVVRILDQPAGLRRVRFDETVPLLPGANRFSLQAENAKARAVPVEVLLQGPVPAAPEELASGQPPPRGRLFVLSVGVSDFAVADTPEAAGHKRLRYAHRDAQALVRGLAAPGNRAFDKIEATLLTDREATKQAVLDALDALCARIHRRAAAPGAERDVLLVFLSGHGVRLKGEPDLYFWCWDLVATYERLAETGLSMLDLGDRIASVPAEVVLLVDACHSAMAGSNLLAGLDADELARRVHAIHERGMYILSAAQAEERAREDPVNKLGVFTAALLSALPKGRKGAVTMAGLIDVVQRQVPEFGRRAGVKPQTPVCRTFGDLLQLTIFER